VADSSRYKEEREKHRSDLLHQTLDDFQGKREEIAALVDELVQLEEKIKHEAEELKDLEEMGSTNPLLVNAVSAAKLDLSKAKKRRAATKGSITRKKRKLNELESLKFPEGGEYEDANEQTVLRPAQLNPVEIVEEEVLVESGQILFVGKTLIGADCHVEFEGGYFKAKIVDFDSISGLYTVYYVHESEVEKEVNFDQISFQHMDWQPTS
jgi:hypothetical protein